MAKLLGFLLVLGALAAGAAWVPVGGRTVLDRWQRAHGPAEFARGAWSEVAVATGLRDAPARRSQVARRPAAAAQRPAPVERHTDADRAALERIVSEHAQK